MLRPITRLLQLVAGGIAAAKVEKTSYPQVGTVRRAGPALYAHQTGNAA